MWLFSGQSVRLVKRAQIENLCTHYNITQNYIPEFPSYVQRVNQCIIYVRYSRVRMSARGREREEGKGRQRMHVVLTWYRGPMHQIAKQRIYPVCETERERADRALTLRYYRAINWPYENEAWFCRCIYTRICASYAKGCRWWLRYKTIRSVLIDACIFRTHGFEHQRNAFDLTVRNSCAF